MSFAEEYLSELATLAAAIDIRPLDDAVAALRRAADSGQVIAAIGNGGSAATAAHFVADLALLSRQTGKSIKAIDVIANAAAYTGAANDLSWAAAQGQLLDPWMSRGSVLVVFSVGGGTTRSENLVRSLERARDAGATCIGVLGHPGGRMAEICDVVLMAPPVSAGRMGAALTETVHVALHHLLCLQLRASLTDTGPDDWAITPKVG